ncbi:MAG TPA: EamA family transporter [Thermoanaerobaculia bacterium]
MSVSALRGQRLAMYVGLCLVWGSTWMVIKIGLRDLSALWFAGIRMALACALIAPFALSGRVRPRGAAAGGRTVTRRVLWAGILQIGVNYACIFLAEVRIDSGLAAVLFATFPLFVALFAHAMLPDEPLTPRTAASAGLGLLGVAVIEAPALATVFSHEARALLEGSAFVLTSSVVAAYANVYNKKYFPDVPPVWNVWLQTLSGSLLLLALAAVFEPGAPMHWTPRAVGALLYLSILGTALPFAGLFWLLRRVPMSVIGTIPIVDTVIAVVLGSLVLSESFSPRVLAGAALILVAVLLAAAPVRAAAQERKKKETAAIR